MDHTYTNPQTLDYLGFHLNEEKVKEPVKEAVKEPVKKTVKAVAKKVEEVNSLR